jgi:hypothetical protein
VNRLVGLLTRIEDPIRRRLLLRRGADVFGLEESVLLEAVSGKGRRVGGTRTRAKAQAPAAEAAVSSAPAGAGTPVQASELESGPPDPVERELAGRVLTEEGALAEVLALGAGMCFRSRTLRELLEPWLMQQRPPRHEELDELIQGSPVTRELLAELHPEPGRTLETSRKEARGLIQRLEERRLKASIQALDRAIRDAERSRDEGSLGRLVAERRDLTDKLHTRSSTAIQ